ncbi:MAG TPA: phosphoribosylformylglycinamidine synthase subunit PurQ [bacterium]|jgi:phosphoribosylformylglycinamidine synthase
MMFGVVVFPGSNCDRDCLHVLRSVLQEDVVELWHGDPTVQSVDCVVLPGGFAYGDYLRAGAIAATSPVMDAVRRFARMGGIVLGICNGFQVLLESGLLPGAMIRNAPLQFRCRDVWLRVESADTPFTSGLRIGQILKMPIAHGEGNFYAPAATLDALEQARHVVFRYCDPSGGVTPEANPNGALRNIAGICNPRGNVLGLMPHPERASEAILGSTDGQLLFESAIAWLAARQSLAPSIDPHPNPLPHAGEGEDGGPRGRGKGEGVGTRR